MLPSWFGDALSIIAVALGLPSLILWVLGRKDANRKLKVEEGSLKKSVFDSQTETYQDLLDRANAATDRANAAADSLNSRVVEMREELGELREMLRSIRDLFRRVVQRNGITLTAAEQREFESTRPRPRRHHRPA